MNFKIIRSYFYYRSTGIKPGKQLPGCTITVIDTSGKVNFTPFVYEKDPSNLFKTANELIDYNTGAFSTLTVTRPNKTALDNRVNGLIDRLKTEHNLYVSNFELSMFTDPADIDSNPTDGTFV